MFLGRIFTEEDGTGKVKLVIEPIHTEYTKMHDIGPYGVESGVCLPGRILRAGKDSDVMQNAGISPTTQVLISPEAKQLLLFLISDKNPNIIDRVFDKTLTLKIKPYGHGSIVFVPNDGVRLVIDENTKIYSLDVDLQPDVLNDMVLADNELLKKLDMSGPIDENEVFREQAKEK